MLLYLLKPNGDDQNSVNVADAVWAVPANQTQIAQWVAAQGFTFYTDTVGDPDDQTLLNIGQVQAWIQGQVNEQAGATLPPATTTATAPASSWGAIAVVGLLLVGGGAGVWWALNSRAPLENPSRCGPAIDTKHHPNCRPGRPLCRYRRRERGICTCTAYHFPHRRDSGACRSGVPDSISRSPSYRRSGER